MDLFNRKKVAALQSDLALATAQLKATTKELADLQSDIVKSYDELTEYFKPRYKNKYFKLELTPEQDEIEGVVYMQVLNVKYEAGSIILKIIEEINSATTSNLYVLPSELKRLKVITKKEFIEFASKGGQE